MDEPAFLSDPDLKESALLRLLFEALGRRLNPSLLARLARRFEGGEMHSRTLRRLLWHRYGVKAEAFSYGAFHEPSASEPGLTIGRFASISRDVRWGLGHPMDHVALSHFFAQPQNGFAEQWPFERPTLEIGADAWIGAQVVITSGCRRIGIGAAVGAGSVVTHDVPDFAIAYGSPARAVRYRFPEPVRERILASRWWERSAGELREARQAFVASVDADGALDALAKLGDR
jgi:virginiamycin A acetyltransferase